MSIKLEDLQTILIESGLPADQRAVVIKTAEDFEAANKEEGAKAPKNKQKFTVLIRGDKSLESIVQQAWIVRVPEEEDDNYITHKLKLAAVRHNENIKKAKWKVTLWRDVFAFIKRKTTKDPEVNVDIKTKEPVRVIIIDQEEVNFD